MRAELRQWLKRRVPIAWVQLGVVLTLLAVLPLAKEVDPDFWWHLRTGKLIVESGIPRHDPFSWTAAGKVWVAHEWLSEVIIYGVESTLGYIGNVAFFGAVISAALLLMYAMGRRLGAGTKPLVLLAFVAALALARFVTVRPQEFTWLLFAVFVYVLQRHEEGDAMPLWVLPPLMALWVNLHLGFFYGLLVVGVWLLVQVFRHARTEPSKLRAPLMVAGACLLATLLNPNGPEILAYPAQYLQGSGERSLIAEWQRPDFTSPLSIPIALALILLVASLLSRRRPFLWLLSAAFIAFSLQAVRNVPFAVLLLSPMVGSAAAGRWLLLSRHRDSGTTLPVVGSAVLLAALAGCVFVIAPTVGGTVSGYHPSGYGYPVAGESFVESHYQTARLYNEYGWGGYLIDRLYPDVPVFIDGREEFYGETIFGDYLHIAKTEEGWDDLLAQYGVDVALLRRDSRLAKAMRASNNWQEEFTGPVEAVFVRRHS
ncbi:MAG: hypothetical protein MUP15_07330 [Dehalococcoidia bacterium]|nr:hypothetical protein [Dehalococcoidia bacterium]